MGTRILVIDRGFVLVARCPDPAASGLWLQCEVARTVRRWGTTDHGLGGLTDGPRPETVLDDHMYGVKVPVRAILFTLDVAEDAWASHLS